MTTNADVIVTKLIKFITDAAGSSLDAATTAKLTATGTILGQLANIIVPTLEQHNATMSAILDAVSALEDDADKLALDVNGLIAAIKGDATGTVASPA